MSHYLKKEALILVLTLPIIMSSPRQIGPEETNAPDYFILSEAAYRRADVLSFLENSKQAVRIAPENPKYLFTLARAYALQSNQEKAIRCLAMIVDMGFFFSSKNSESQENEDDDFDCLKGSDEYQTILRKIQKINKPVHNSEIAFEIYEKDLMPEGLAYDPVEQAFYLGSVYKRKIIKIDKFGHSENFTKEMQDGLWSVLGTEVDAKRRVLWVNSSSLRKMKGSTKDNLGSAGVFKYDLATRRLIKKYLLGNRPLHLFNSLAVNSKGDVFITDSLFGAVYLISQEKDALELFVRPIRFSFPNGIALSSDDQFLYVSHAEGTSVIDIQSRSCSLLSHPSEVSLDLIDGLSFYRGSLVAIQNGFRPERLVQFFLNKELDRADSVRILESNNPLFQFPTTGVVVGNTFYYIANSQLTRYFPDQKSFPMEKLQNILIMKVEL